MGVLCPKRGFGRLSGGEDDRVVHGEDMPQAVDQTASRSHGLFVSFVLQVDTPVQWAVTLCKE